MFTFYLEYNAAFLSCREWNRPKQVEDAFKAIELFMNYEDHPIFNDKCYRLFGKTCDSTIYNKFKSWNRFTYPKIWGYPFETLERRLLYEDGVENIKGKYDEKKEKDKADYDLKTCVERTAWIQDDNQTIKLLGCTPFELFQLFMGMDVSCVGMEHERVETEDYGTVSAAQEDTDHHGNAVILFKTDTLIPDKYINKVIDCMVQNVGFKRIEKFFEGSVASHLQDSEHDHAIDLEKRVNEELGILQNYKSKNVDKRKACKELFEIWFDKDALRGPIAVTRYLRQERKLILNPMTVYALHYDDARDFQGDASEPNGTYHAVENQEDNNSADKPWVNHAITRWIRQETDANIEQIMSPLQQKINGKMGPDFKWKTRRLTVRQQEEFVGELNKEKQKLQSLATFVCVDYRQFEEGRNKYEEVENKLNDYIEKKYFYEDDEEIEKAEDTFVEERQNMVILLRKLNGDE